jgi:hypothetical protein
LPDALDDGAPAERGSGSPHIPGGCIVELGKGRGL